MTAAGVPFRRHDATTNGAQEKPAMTPEQRATVTLSLGTMLLEAKCLGTRADEFDAIANRLRMHAETLRAEVRGIAAALAIELPSGELR